MTKEQGITKLRKVVDAEAELADLRRAIDGVDGALVALLARRFGFVQNVVEVKKALGLPAAIPARVEEVITRVRAEAAAQGFLADTAEKLWRQLIADMIAFEEKALEHRANK
jgi:isochorismate pyruvate lyase